MPRSKSGQVRRRTQIRQRQQRRLKRKKAALKELLQTAALNIPHFDSGGSLCPPTLLFQNEQTLMVATGQSLHDALQHTPS